MPRKISTRVSLESPRVSLGPSLDAEGYAGFKPEPTVAEQVAQDAVKHHDALYASIAADSEAAVQRAVRAQGADMRVLVAVLRQYIQVRNCGDMTLWQGDVAVVGGRGARSNLPIYSCDYQIYQISFAFTSRRHLSGWASSRPRLSCLA